MSVNSGILSDTYLGAPYKLKLPTINDAIDMIRSHGRGCLMYSLDLARAYRQLRSDPLDWPLLGLQWNKELYVDVAIPFGICWGAMACSSTTQAVCYVHKEVYKHDSTCYIDDFFCVCVCFISLPLPGRSWFSQSPQYSAGARAGGSPRQSHTSNHKANLDRFWIGHCRHGGTNSTKTPALKKHCPWHSNGRPEPMPRDISYNKS